MKKFNKKSFYLNLHTKYIGRELFYFDKIDSTNNFASKMETLFYCTAPLKSAKNNSGSILEINSLKKLNGLIILSEIQEKGHGRFDKTWFSNEGGLWFTIILQPMITEKYLPMITLLTSISITEILKKDYRIDVKVKWPNDIYFKDFKLCGILCETEKIKELSYLNIGVGINVNNSLDDINFNIKIKAISIKEILGEEVKRELLLARIINNFEKYYEYYLKSGDFNKILKIIKNNIIL
ncbi:MAG: biotin--[acetyl-CoA-carboxylase] ligase [Actinobacteria bacterium]|nr:biotin--[acetyl-CoA-carboxylase] ligase [Actinomycetota bacterium]